MNLRHISTNQIIVWVALLLGLGVSVMIGSAVGSSDIRMVAGVIAAIPVAVIFVKLKTNIWVLIPIGWYLSGRLPWLPVPFTVRDLCMMTAIFFFTLFFATRALPWRRKLGMLDYLIYINLAYLATVYVRNPAGFWAMQTSVVGGRPYFEIALAFGAFIILSRVQISLKLAKVFPWFFLVPAWAVATLDLIGRLLPQTSYILNGVYSGVGTSSTSAIVQQEARLGETRMTGVVGAGVTTLLTLYSKYNPLTLVSPLYPGRFLVLVVGFSAIFISGYRGALLFAVIAFLLSTILRGRFRDLWIAGAIAIVALMVIVAAQGTFVQLPTTMQRALSWLPGDWSQEARADAENSSRWRFEMWQWAWNDDRILRDKIWGTGFGLSIDDMNLIANSMLAGQGGASLLGGSDRENFMITGTFHSGPLSSVKYIGVVGLCLYFPLMCYMAFLAFKVCLKARDTPALPLALFVCIPIIYEPFNFTVVFGALEGSYPQTLFWAGMLHLTRNYVDKISVKPKYSKAIANKEEPAMNSVTV